MRWTGTSDSQTDRRDYCCGGICCFRTRRRAQSSSGGLPDLFGNIFSGPKPANGATASPRRPTARRSLERRGRRLRPSLDDGGRDPPGGGEFQNCVASMWPDAARRNITRENFRRFTADAAARSAHHGSDGFAARIHQGDLGLSRHPRERQPASPRAARSSPNTSRSSTRRKRPMASTATSIASIWGIEIQLLDADGRPQRAATPPRRWPASAAARPTSRMSS